MPCEINPCHIGRTVAYRWFCCKCGEGPYEYAIQKSCIDCDHELCCDRVISSQTPSVNINPATPAGQLTGLETPQPVLLSGSSSAPLDSGASCEFGKLNSDWDLVHLGSPHDLIFNVNCQPTTKSGLESGRRKLPTVPIVHQSPTRDLSRHRPGGESSLCGSERRQRPLEGSSCAPHRGFKRPWSPVAPLAEDSDASGDDDDDEERSPAKKPITIRYRDATRKERKIYACPFYKNNPHKYKHHKSSCTHPHEMSRLREHLIGKKQKQNGTRHGPHTIHECETCLEVFPNHDALETHGPCVPGTHVCHPAEGIGIRLVPQIDELDRGPKDEACETKNQQLWAKWYTVLFGHGIEIPNCYHEENYMPLRYEPDPQDYDWSQLRLTFSRRLPAEHKAMVLRCYLKSLQEGILHRLSGSVPDDELQAICNILNRQSTVSSKKGHVPRKKRQEALESLHQPTPVHDGTNARTVQRAWARGSLERPELPSKPNTALDATDGTMHIHQLASSPDHAVPPMSPMPMAFLTEDPIALYGLPHPDVPAPYEPFSPLHPSYQYTVSLEGDQTLFHMSDDTYMPTMTGFSDALEPLCPESLPINPQSPQEPFVIRPQHLSPRGRTNHTAGSGLCKREWATDVPQQSTKHHGSFDQDPLDPRSVASFPEPLAGGELQPLLDDFGNPMGHSDIGFF